jgi:hypothetical protein
MVLEKYEMQYEMKWVKLAHPGSLMPPEGLGREGNGQPTRQWACPDKYCSNEYGHVTHIAQHLEKLINISIREVMFCRKIVYLKF